MEKIQGGAVYASTSFITDYLKDKSLPKIHTSMGEAMAMVPVADRKGAIDFGACHGMLSLRARSMGWGPCLGIEADLPSINLHNQFINDPLTTLVHYKTDVRSQKFADDMKSFFTKYDINTVLARRVLSELFSTTYGKAGKDEAVWKDAGRRFSQAVIAAGAQYIVLEGREYRANASHPIYNTDKEIEALDPSLWTVIGRSKEAVTMVPA